MGNHCASFKNKNISINNNKNNFDKDKTLTNQISITKVPSITKNVINDIVNKPKPLNYQLVNDDIISCCSICFNVYNNSDRFPGILLCGHTFCIKCIDDQFSINDQQYLICPFCKKTNITKYTKNYAFMDIVMKQKLAKEKINNEQEIKHNLDSKQKNIQKKFESNNDYTFKYSEFETSKCYCYTCEKEKKCSYCSKGDNNNANNDNNNNDNDNNSNNGNNDNNNNDNDNNSSNYYDNDNNNSRSNYYDNDNNNSSNYYGIKHKNNIPSPTIYGYSRSIPKTCLNVNDNKKLDNIVIYTNSNFNKNHTFSIYSEKEFLRKKERNLISNHENYKNNRNKEIKDKN